MKYLAAAYVLLLASCGAHAFAQAPSQFFANGQAPVAPGVVIVAFDSFAVGYSEALGEPLWSAQHETAVSVAAGAAVKRNGAFHQCDLPDGTKSVSPSLYAKSGFDLGHMTEAAAPANKPPTFGSCNLVPQRPGLNRISWAGIEASVRNLATSGEDLYVVTGPVLPAGAPLLAGRVAIPSKTWKAVLDVGKGAEAWDCTNSNTPACVQEDIPTLAAEIGFDPFPGVEAALKTPIALPPPTKGSISN